MSQAPVTVREKERKISVSVLVQKIIEATWDQLPIKETLALLIAFAACWLIDRRGKERKITLRWVFSVFLVLYVTVLRREQQESLVRLRPFQFITLRTLYIDFLNAVLFLPLGYETWRRCGKQDNLQKIKRSLVYGVVLSFFVELMQLVFKRGVFDTEDLIFNTIGTLLGGILYQCIMNFLGRRSIFIRVGRN